MSQSKVLLVIFSYGIGIWKEQNVHDMNKQNEKPVTITSNGTVLIVNPSSSSGSTGKGWDDFFLKAKEIFGGNPEIAFTKKSGDGTTLAREYLKKGFKNVVAIGGDGTINEVANGFFFFEKDKEKAVVGGHTNDDRTNTTTVTHAIIEPSTLRQINPDAVFGIVSSGTYLSFKDIELLRQDISHC